MFFSKKSTKKAERISIRRNQNAIRKIVRTLNVESLERRELMAANVFNDQFNLTNGSLNYSPAIALNVLSNDNDGAVSQQVSGANLDYTNANKAGNSAIYSIPLRPSTTIPQRSLIVGGVAIGTVTNYADIAISIGVAVVSHPSNITGFYDTPTFVLTLTRTDTVANYQLALRSVLFSNTNATPATNARVVTFQVNDGASTNNLSNQASRQILMGDFTSPTIGSVKVAGSAWNSGFTNFVDPADGDNTDGNDGTGFQIPTDTPANQLRPLSWTNMNSIVLAFSEPVTGVNLANLQMIGVNKLDYKASGGIEPQLTGVTYNSTTNEATLSFNGSLTADKLLIRIGAGLVQDIAGNALAAYSFRLNVLPGDVTQNGVVANNDITLIRAQLGLAPGSVGFDPRRDLNGNGVIANNDVTLARARLGNQLPPTDPI